MPIRIPAGRISSSGTSRSSTLFRGLALSWLLPAAARQQYLDAQPGRRPGQRLHPRAESHPRSTENRCRSTTWRRASSARLMTSIQFVGERDPVSGHRRHGERAVARRTFLGGASTGRSLSITVRGRGSQQLAFLRSNGVRCSAPDAIQAVWQRGPAGRRSPGSEFPEPARERPPRHLFGRPVHPADIDSDERQRPAERAG